MNFYVGSKGVKMKSEDTKPNLSNCCPYCCAPIEKIYACHPFSSDAGEYYVCDVCNAIFEPDEYEDLIGEGE
jgi:hypothetical protein